MSMVFTCSLCRVAWIHRMVYFPDEDLYDLIPEFKFPESLKWIGDVWTTKNIPYCGAIVQPLRTDTLGENADDENDSVARMGVKIVSVSRNGEANWWIVKRHDNEQVGIESIVL
jgi:hypothetical protein